MRHILENCCANMQRTSKADRELTKKNSKLTGKQRQFLLLLDKKEQISKEMCLHLLHQINIEQLFNVGLLKLVETTNHMPSDNCAFNVCA